MPRCETCIDLSPRLQPAVQNVNFVTVLREIRQVALQFVTASEMTTDLQHRNLLKFQKKDPWTKLQVQLMIRTLRSADGQLNWLDGISRPEISFHVCEPSTKVKNATKSDFLSM